jgi:hypothetical protein
MISMLMDTILLRMASLGILISYCGKIFKKTFLPVSGFKGNLFTKLPLSMEMQFTNQSQHKFRSLDTILFLVPPCQGFHLRQMMNNSKGNIVFV